MLIQLYRLSNWCFAHGLDTCGAIIECLMVITCGAHVSGRAKIQKNVLIVHAGIGVVIHEDAVIGESSIINAGVTIGNTFPHIEGVPRIGKNVYIGCGAFVGGNIDVADHVVIGANSVVTKSIHEGGVIVAGNPAKVRRKLTDAEMELLNWNINRTRKAESLKRT